MMTTSIQELDGKFVGDVIRNVLELTGFVSLFDFK